MKEDPAAEECENGFETHQESGSDGVEMLLRDHLERKSDGTGTDTAEEPEWSGSANAVKIPCFLTKCGGDESQRGGDDKLDAG